LYFFLNDKTPKHFIQELSDQDLLDVLPENITKRDYTKLKRRVYSTVEVLWRPFRDFEPHTIVEVKNCNFFLINFFSKDFEDYTRTFTLADEYENGTLSRYHWAMEMLSERFELLWNVKLKDV